MPIITPGGIGGGGLVSKQAAPFNLDDVLAWWDFTNPENTLDTNTTTTVAYVRDKSGNNRHLEQPNKSLQPAFVAGEGASFSGTNVLAMISSGRSGFMRNIQAFTSAALVKSNISGTSNQALWMAGTNASTSTARARHVHNSSGTIKDVCRILHTGVQGTTADSGNTTDTSTVPSTAHTNNTAKSHIIKADLANNTVDFFVDNTSKGQTTPFGGTGRWLCDSDPAGVAVGNFLTGTLPLNGTLKDLIIFRSKISEAVRADVEAYMASRKW